MSTIGALIQGDWKVDVTDEGDCYVRIPGGHDWYFGDLETTDGCCFAVAQLVATAPELLDCLKELVDLMEAVIEGEYRPDSFTTQPARLAIKKAEGELND